MAGNFHHLVPTKSSIRASLANSRPPVLVSTGGGEMHVAEGALAFGQLYVGLVCSRSSPLLHDVREKGAFALTVLPDQQNVDPEAAGRNAERLPAQRVDGMFVRGGTLFLECVLDRIVERLGDTVLIVAGVVASWEEASVAQQRDAGECVPSHSGHSAHYVHAGATC